MSGQFEPLNIIWLLSFKGIYSPDYSVSTRKLGGEVWKAMNMLCQTVRADPDFTRERSGTMQTERGDGSCLGCALDALESKAAFGRPREGADALEIALAWESLRT
ncbi:Phe13-bombesin receptor-like [Platysternon megacephalum]|uniref:Phe13-bombesin receptor-like n=1 Tax=Platysternon megacephalum TaxID=55544 RepID=A0A4D9F0W6_9SAUR|nr:Phe13-bombesin receptor-like [Platysternon megacephalum]